MYVEVAMSDKHTLGPWVRRFLMEHLPDDRNLSRNTQQSYRDALRLLIVFVSTGASKTLVRTAFEQGCENTATPASSP
jgi:site-specific recombinase XerD